MDFKVPLCFCNIKNDKWIKITINNRKYTLFDRKCKDKFRSFSQFANKTGNTPYPLPYKRESPTSRLDICTFFRYILIELLVVDPK